MQITIRAEGLNLERLLCAAAQAGVRVRGVRREASRSILCDVSALHLPRLMEIAGRSGFTIQEKKAGPAVRMLRCLRRRWTLAAAMLLSLMLTAASTKLLLRVEIEHAGKEEAAVRSVLREEGAVPGCLLSQLSSDRLRARLEYALPGLSFAGIRFAGSTMIVDCRPAAEPEAAGTGGKGADIVAACDGIVTQIWALSGTPEVEPGDAVRRGQVLIRGEERGRQAGVVPVRAQGQVLARVWARGSAKASLYTVRTVESGRTRRRVMLTTPWGSRVVREAEPFASQDIIERTETIAGLYLPVQRRTEIYVENRIERTLRNQADAMSLAQGAAERIAKNNSPINARILDKWVDYCMIDNEFVCATVVLEYEQDVAARM